VHILSEPTNDREATYDAIRSTKIATGTSLYEALEAVMKSQLKRIEGRKAIILFTDGVDTTSRRTSAVKNLNDAMELDSLIYPVRYDTYWDVQRMKTDTGLPRPPPRPRTIPAQSDITLPFPFPTRGRQTVEGTTLEDYKVAREYLDELAFRTGGRVYQADNLHKLTEGFANIAGELREFYSLGIYPDDAEPGTLRNVRVRVDKPSLVVRARDTFRTGRKAPGK
jgi:Ca-activated chloride channel family protein